MSNYPLFSAATVEDSAIAIRTDERARMVADSIMCVHRGERRMRDDRQAGCVPFAQKPISDAVAERIERYCEPWNDVDENTFAIY